LSHLVLSRSGTVSLQIFNFYTLKHILLFFVVPLIKSTKCDNLCAKTSTTKPFLNLDQKENKSMPHLPDRGM